MFSLSQLIDHWPVCHLMCSFCNKLMHCQFSTQCSFSLRKASEQLWTCLEGESVYSEVQLNRFEHVQGDPCTVRSNWISLNISEKWGWGPFVVRAGDWDWDQGHGHGWDQRSQCNTQGHVQTCSLAPLPRTDRMTKSHDWKHYLPQVRWWPVKMT